MMLRGLRGGKRVRVRIGKSWIDPKKIVREPVYIFVVIYVLGVTYVCPSEHARPRSSSCTCP